MSVVVFLQKHFEQLFLSNIQSATFIPIMQDDDSLSVKYVDTTFFSFLLLLSCVLLILSLTLDNGMIDSNHHLYDNIHTTTFLFFT